MRELQIVLQSLQKNRCGPHSERDEGEYKDAPQSNSSQNRISNFPTDRGATSVSKDGRSYSPGVWSSVEISNIFDDVILRNSRTSTPKDADKRMADDIQTPQSPLDVPSSQSKQPLRVVILYISASVLCVGLSLRLAKSLVRDFGIQIFSVSYPNI